MRDKICVPATSPSPHNTSLTSTSPKSSSSAKVVLRPMECGSQLGTRSNQPLGTSKATIKSRCRQQPDIEDLIQSRVCARTPAQPRHARAARLRSTVKSSVGTGTSFSSVRRRRNNSTFSIGQPAKLAMVRLRISLPPSRRLSRSKTAGGELRLGTMSIYMVSYVYHI